MCGNVTFPAFPVRVKGEAGFLLKSSAESEIRDTQATNEGIYRATAGEAFKLDTFRV